MDYSSSTDSDVTDTDSENEYDLCCTRDSGSCSMHFNSTCTRGLSSNGLVFDPASIENVILTISDQFNLRVVLSDSRAKKAALVTAGLTLAGGLIGKHYGGKAGVAVGSAIGGVCGLGIVAMSMRDMWQDIKGRLSELFDLVYDYLAGLGIEDYKMAVTFLMQHSGQSSQLAMLILQVTSNVLKKTIISSLTMA